MANPQTTETASQVLYGAVKIEVATASTFAGAVDVGAVNGAKLTEELKIATYETDNVVDRDVVSDQTGMVEFEQIQAFNEAARVIMRGTLDTVENVSGSLVTGATQTIYSGSWVYNQFTPIKNQNGSGATIAITSVTAATDGVLAAALDYFLVKNDDGIYGIIIVDSSKVTTQAQNIAIVYNYTPNASVNYFTGGKSVLTPFYMRLKNTDENGKVATWTMLGPCTINSGDEMAFKKYNADDARVSIPVKIKVRRDITLTAGKQLWVKNVTS